MPPIMGVLWIAVIVLTVFWAIWFPYINRKEESSNHD